MRNRAGLGVRELAKLLGFGHARISLWETGKKTATVEDVTKYLAAIKITGEERERLLDMARRATKPVSTAGIPGISEELGALMEFEREALGVTSWAPLLIPGLLQTGDYARAIMGDVPSADTRVAMRLGRQDILSRRNPVALTAIISEGALRQPVAEPDVMTDQLDHVLSVAERRNVTIQVMPASMRYHPGLAGPFILLEFPKAKPVVHFEHYRASAFVFDDDDVSAYVEMVGLLCRLAMNPDESVEFIRKLVREIAA